MAQVEAVAVVAAAVTEAGNTYVGRAEAEAVAEVGNIHLLMSVGGSSSCLPN